MTKLWCAVRAALAACLVALSAATPVAARPFSVEDLLRQESFGGGAIDPSGRKFVFEQQDRFESAPRFDYDMSTLKALSRLKVVDLDRESAARPLLKRDPGPGVVMGPYSPSGRRLAIYRLHGWRWTLGVVTLDSGAVKWFPEITPEEAFYGRTLQWLTDRELLVIQRPDGVPSWPLRMSHASAQVLPGRWAATARGVGSHMVVGSGAYADLRPRPTPRRLLRLDVVSGALRRLATGELLDIELSPDHRRVALFESGRNLQSRADGPVQGAWGISTEATLVSIVDLATGAQRRPCPDADALPHLLSWSPNGQALLVFVRGDASPWTDGKFLRIDAATGAARQVAAELTPRLRLRPEIVYAGWMGDDPIVLGRLASDGEGRPDWFRLAASGPVKLTGGLPEVAQSVRAVDDTGLTLIANGRLWRVTAAGVATQISDSAAAAANEPHSTWGARLENAPQIGSWVYIGQGAGRQVQWLSSEGLKPVASLPESADGVFAASVSQSAVIVRRVEADGQESLLRTGHGTPPDRIVQINRDMGSVEATRIVPIAHKGPEGQALTSWLFLPPGPAAPRPLIVRPYPGAAYSEAPNDPPSIFGFMTSVRMMVGHGYAVLVPSLPLARGRTDPMPGIAGRILEIVDAAAHAPASSGAFDPTQLALWGHSYGGYAVMAAITQTDRFRVAVSLSGLSDLESKWETMQTPYRVAPEEGLMVNWSAGSTESGQDEMRRPPWEDPERYRRNSPLMAADRIHTPLMLIHGEQDPIPLAQSEAMFAALYRQDKDAILVTYWGESHAVLSPGNVRDMYARAFAFLDEHVRRPSPIAAAAPGPSPAAGLASDAPTPPGSPPPASR